MTSGDMVYERAGRNVKNVCKQACSSALMRMMSDPHSLTFGKVAVIFTLAGLEKREGK